MNDWWGSGIFTGSLPLASRWLRDCLPASSGLYREQGGYHSGGWKTLSIMATMTQDVKDFLIVKLFKATAVTFTLAGALALGACSSSDDTTDTTTATSGAEQTSSSESSGMASEYPTAEELNQILAIATDPEASIDDKINTVEGSENAPELFETMTQAKVESGAEFQVVGSVLPGYDPQSEVLTTVMFTLPDRPDQEAEGVEFVNVDGNWQLSQDWACILITNTVAPEQVPAMCVGTETDAVAPAEGGAAEAPVEAPAEEAAPVQ